MTDTKHDIYIVDKATKETHRARKIIFSDDDISVWSESWYGRHVIGQDCEFEQPKVDESTMIAALANVRITLGALLNTPQFDNVFKQWIKPLHERAVAITNEYGIGRTLTETEKPKIYECEKCGCSVTEGQGYKTVTGFSCVVCSGI